MAEHGLDRSDIGTVAEEVGGIRVTQCVGRYVLADDAGLGSVFFDDPLYGARSQAQVGRLRKLFILRNTDKQCFICVRTLINPSSNMATGVIRQEHEPDLPTLTHYRELAALGVDLVAIQCTEF